MGLGLMGVMIRRKIVKDTYMHVVLDEQKMNK